MGRMAILFNGAEPFEQILNTPSTDNPMWNFINIDYVVSEKKLFKD